MILDIVVGVEKDFPEQLFALPYKKKINQKDLSIEEEKEYNKIHSKKKRIVIEHTLCRLKKYSDNA
ncbi:MAG: transposase family protein [Thermoproteota archaeon]|nr:transposase family protein [Thermoproteota archaeon]